MSKCDSYWAMAGFTHVILMAESPFYWTTLSLLLPFLHMLFYKTGSAKILAMNQDQYSVFDGFRSYNDRIYSCPPPHFYL